jgi:hypothetical protein
MKVLVPYVLLAATALWAHAAEVSRSFFDIQLSYPKERWRAVAYTNQPQGTGELMLMKEGKGKVVHVSLEKKVPEEAAFDEGELKRMQQQGTSASYKTLSRSFTNFLGERAYRITSEGKDGDLRGFSVAHFFYRGEQRYRVLAVCFEGKEPEQDEEIGSILKSMKLAK